jgi:hypothetical protein
MQTMYTYKELLTGFRKGHRNGNWSKLSRLGEGVIQGFALVLEGSRCGNK